MTAVLDHPLATLSDDELAERYCTPDADVAALKAEDDRREHNRQQAANRRWLAQRDWQDQAHAQYLAAESECAGVLLNRRGVARGIEPFSLWSGSQWTRDAYASEELTDFWSRHPLVTWADWKRQQGAGEETYRDELDRDDSAGVRQDASQGREGAAGSRDGRRDAVPAADARACQQAGQGTGADAGRSAAVRRPAVNGPEPVRLTPSHPVVVIPVTPDPLAAARARLAERGTQLRQQSRPVAAPVQEDGFTGSARSQVSVPIQRAELAQRNTGTVAQPDEKAAMIAAETMRYAERVMRRHVDWPDQESLDTVLLWCLHANARDRDETGSGPLIWRASPRLMLTSGERGSGKSTALDLVAILTGSRFGRLPKITAPAFAKLMGKFREPAVIDEARMVFGTGTRSAELQGMMLAGYTARASALTAKGGGDGESLFGPVAYAAKDNLITQAGDSVLDLLDRSLIIRLRRAERHYPDIDDQAEKVATLASRGMATWTGMVRADLLAAASDLSRQACESGDVIEGGDARSAQIWRPLLACAAVLGGDWPQRAENARQAASMPAAASADDDWMSELQQAGDALSGLFDEDEA